MHRIWGVKLLSVSEVAREKGVSREAVYQAIRRGQLKARRVLGRIGVVERSLGAYEPRREKVEAGRERARQVGLKERGRAAAGD